MVIVSTPVLLWPTLGLLYMCCTSCQCLQQRFGLLEVSSVKPLGEPTVDLHQQLTGFGTLPLALPQARQAHRRPQLQGFGLLTAGDGEGLMKIGFCLPLKLRR